MASDGHCIGGMEQQVALQANYIAARHDTQVSILAHRNYQRLFSTATAFHHLDTRRSRRNPFLKKQVRQAIERISPDLVHSHGHKATSLLTSIKLDFPKLRLLATAHGTKKTNRQFEKIDHVFAVSLGVQNALSPIESSVIGNAVALFQGLPCSKQELCLTYQWDPRKPLLLAIGRLAPVKQYDRLMPAFHGLDANLLICGTGPELKKLTKLQATNVRLAGHIDGVRRFLPGADALVISSAREGFSLSMIEALQQGTPVISTPVSGTRDLLPESAIIEISKPSELAKSLSLKLKQLPMLKADSESAFRFAQQKCTPEYVVDLLMTHYHALLDAA